MAVSYVNSLPSPQSRRQAITRLDAMCSFLAKQPADSRHFPWELLRVRHTRNIRAWLERRTRSSATSPNHLRESTANQYLGSLRDLLKHAWRLGRISAEDYCQAIDLQNFSTAPTPPQGRVLTVREVRSLTHRCRTDHRPTGARDATILGLALCAGLRLGQMADLNLEDLAVDTGLLRVRQPGPVGWRSIPLDTGTMAAAREWINYRGVLPGPLLYTATQSGRISPARMSPPAIARRLSIRAREAKIRSVTINDTRRTFMSGLFTAGYDIRAIRIMGGLNSLAATARYDRELRRDHGYSAQPLPWWARPRSTTTEPQRLDSWRRHKRA